MKKILKYVMWIVIIAIFVGTFVYLFINSRPKEMVYEIISPTKGSIERTTLLTGKIEPRDEIEIKPQVSGIISEINVEAGDMVNEGDVIAKIKIVPDEGQLSSATTRIENARISLSDAKRKYERNKVLLEKKVISREEFETAEIKLKEAETELDAAQDAYAIVKEGVSKKNAKQSSTLVRATITGLILDVPVKVGSSVIQANTMNDGTTVATIADMNKLIFKGKVDETEVDQLQTGQPMDIFIGAIPDDTLHATIEYIAPKGTELNGANTFEIKAAIDATQAHNLRAGYSANARVSLSKKDDVVKIPESVIEFEGEKTFVYFVTDSTSTPMKFDRRPVVTGTSDGINIEVKSGVTTKDRLRGLPINDNPAPAKP